MSDVIRLHTLGEQPEKITMEDLEDDLKEDYQLRRKALVDGIRFQEELEVIKETKEVPVEVKYIAEKIVAMKHVRAPLTDAIDKLNALRDKVPVARTFINIIESQLNLYCATHKRRHFQLMPILLVGKPGIGKTWATQRIAEALGLESFKIDLCQGSESFYLSGCQRGYGTSTPGEVARHLAYSNTANPIGILDEIDKGSFIDGHRPSLTGPLLSLLEPDTAKNFNDASLRVEINTSLVSWIATANDPSKIPDPILNRFHVIEFDDPTLEDMQKIMASLTKELVHEYRLSESITLDCTPEFLEKAIRLPSRVLKRCLFLSISRNMNIIIDTFYYCFTEKDLQHVTPPPNEPRRIGFI